MTKKNLKDALHRISLASQNSMSSKEECGRIAREALAADKKATGYVEARLAALEADDLLDMTDEEVKSELADARVDLAESERCWLKLERDALARLRGEKP